MLYKIDVLKILANSAGNSAPVLESFFSKVAEPAKLATLIKGDFNTGVSL